MPRGEHACEGWYAGRALRDHETNFDRLWKVDLRLLAGTLLPIPSHLVVTHGPFRPECGYLLPMNPHHFVGLTAFSGALTGSGPDERRRG